MPLTKALLTSKARNSMVVNQLFTNDIHDSQLLEQFKAIPRELFVPEAYKHAAYLDQAIPLEYGRYLIEPLMLAKLLQAANLNPSYTVLDVACGSGYTTAILSGLAKQVVAIESHMQLATTAHANINALHIDNVIVLNESLDTNDKKAGLFDLIFINGMIDFIPDSLLKQLGPNGRIIAVFRESYNPNIKLGNAVEVTYPNQQLCIHKLFKVNAQLTVEFCQQKTDFIF